MSHATATNRAIAWIAAEAEGDGNREVGGSPAGGELNEALPVPRKPPQRVEDAQYRPGASAARTPLPENLPAHQFPAQPSEEQAEAQGEEPGDAQVDLQVEMLEDEIDQQRRRAYRNRTVGLLRRYMKYSIETGRLPSVLGSEFFRAQVTSYTVVTFEDRVIFAHDMEICLGRLDEFSRELIARHILQEHDAYNTAKFLHCNEKTVRRMTPLALDQLSEILLDAGLLEEIGENAKNSCQEGEEDEIPLSDCEDDENKF
jgi:hypothetical protein